MRKGARLGAGGAQFSDGVDELNHQARQLTLEFLQRLRNANQLTRRRDIDDEDERDDCKRDKAERSTVIEHQRQIEERHGAREDRGDHRFVQHESDSRDRFSAVFEIACRELSEE